MSNAWAGGSTYQWRNRVRPLVLARDGYLCQIKRPGEWTNRKGEVLRCRVTADCVHHVKGKALTGDDPRYLAAACTPCNLAVGDPTKSVDPEPLPWTDW